MGYPLHVMRSLLEAQVVTPEQETQAEAEAEPERLNVPRTTFVARARVVGIRQWVPIFSPGKEECDGDE